MVLYPLLFVSDKLQALAFPGLYTFLLSLGYTRILEVSKLVFNVPFQHKYGYIRDERILKLTMTIYNTVLQGLIHAQLHQATVKSALCYYIHTLGVLSP